MGNMTNIRMLSMGLILIPGCDPSSTENQPPRARFTHTTPVGLNEAIVFDASESSDADGRIESVAWTFSDGGVASGVRVTKAFSAEGGGWVELTVVDDVGAQGQVREVLDVARDGNPNDCLSWRGRYRLSRQRWPRHAGTQGVVMSITRGFATLDPGWLDLNANSAVRGIGEWHWNSGADIDFRIHERLYIFTGEELDGLNAVRTGSIDGPGGTLARALTWYRGSTVVEIDITVDRAEPWGIGEPDRFDLQAVITHEFGHLWCLDDLYDPEDRWETMYGYSARGQSHQRSLYCGDKRGVQALYGSRSMAETPIASGSTSEGNAKLPARPTITVPSDIGGEPLRRSLTTPLEE